MKQRIRVIGIVRSGEKILLLKRTIGRSEDLPTWELPTGKIRFGEQPEEALARSFYEYLGIEVAKVTLKDVITFVNIAGSSQLANLYIVYEVALPEAKIAPMDRYTAFKYLKTEEMPSLRLDDATISVIEILEGKTRYTLAPTSQYLKELYPPSNDLESSIRAAQNRNALNGATVYVDGGSKGNPGPSAIGYYIVSEDGKEIKRGGEFIGFATSRVAEYYAMKEGMLQARELGLRRVRFVGDNLMMINQLRGIYQVKNQDLIPIYNDIKKLLSSFDSVVFVHVKRAQNIEADMEANKALEGHFKRKKKEF
ncbi:reverse transcriptase-like protein [Candidatus Saccharibacteria bacterium]|nr:reverse transcriptase-like protein [Candidatus Saccharibacteria bacterium]